MLGVSNTKVLIPVPKIYENYVGYDDRKRKKIKTNPLKQESLSAHSEALYGILMKPYMLLTR